MAPFGKLRHFPGQTAPNCAKLRQNKPETAPLLAVNQAPSCKLCHLLEQTCYTLINPHSALAENLLPNAADEGRIRQHAVDIGQSVYRPLSTPQQIGEALDVLLDKASRIGDAFEQSFFMMVHLPYLQRFADINKQTSWLAEPDPLRLAWRDFIKQTIRTVILQPALDPFSEIRQAVADGVPQPEQSAVQALVIEELRRIHEGVLARYGLRPSEYLAWKAAQGH